MSINSGAVHVDTTLMSPLANSKPRAAHQLFTAAPCGQLRRLRNVSFGWGVLNVHSARAPAKNEMPKEKKHLFTRSAVDWWTTLQSECQTFAIIIKKKKNSPIYSSQCLHTIDFNDIRAIVESLLLHTSITLVTGQQCGGH